MKMYKNPIVLYSSILLLLFSNIGSIFYFMFYSKDCPICEENMDIPLHEDLEEATEIKKMVSVDVKGYVKKPGVYTVEQGVIVNDVIKLAGGIKNSGTTDNLNLSKKVEDETVIVVSSKSELKTQTKALPKVTTDSVYEVPEEANNSTTDEKANTTIPIENEKISLNQATKEEFMTLPGIGEKTAEKIIEYRMAQPFTAIEDIKKVSGIGESIFEKIKDFITI